MSDRDEFQEERGLLLSQLMFGWLLDAEHRGCGIEVSHFTLTPEEYRVRMEDVAQREEAAS